MKTSIWLAACVAVALSTSVFANSPAQDKPASKTTTTTVKTKSSPAKAASATTTKTVHKTHVKKS